MTNALGTLISGLAILTGLSFSRAAAQPGIFNGSGNAGAVLHPLTRLLGGQGTINGNSWSPDRWRLAFVSYQYIR
jgi:hypothetical protein